jgi:hypothetical protein
VLADHVGVAAQRGAQSLNRQQVGIRFDPRPEVLNQRLEPGDVEALLAAEVLEDQAMGDTGCLGDLIDRDLVVVAIAEYFAGGGEELGAALAGPLRCQGTRGDGSG